jgi:hypothetical protein
MHRTPENTLNAPPAPAPSPGSAPSLAAAPSPAPSSSSPSAQPPTTPPESSQPASPIPADQNLGHYKFVASLVLFSLVALLLVAPFFRLDLSPLVLALVSLASTFMVLRAVNTLRLAYRIITTDRRYNRLATAAQSESTAQSENAAQSASAPQLTWRHVIVVPIYKETVDTIGHTIRLLSAHPAARTSYVVLCAHEAKDPDHEEKFRRISAEFAGSFVDLIKSVHTLAPGECPGKAPNVNCAVRNFAALQSRQDPARTSFAQTMVTVIDCDTRIDRRYFLELERLAAAVPDAHSAVFAAPTFFESNRYDVPTFVRAMDDLWCLGAAANIFSNSALGFPISNYSLSLRMLDEMGYWDVDYDAVGEDFHTFVKASVRLKREVRLVPIAVPMNNDDVEGHDYRKSLLARYSQSMRHALGISSTSYLLRHLRENPLQPRKWLLFALCLEAHTFPMLYISAALYTLLTAWLGNFNTVFAGRSVELLAGLYFVLAAATNICFITFKLLQYYIRHQIFQKPLNLKRELPADAVDIIVQPICGLSYFILPFGFRMLQNLVYWRNKQYYNKFEEGARKYS